MAASLGNYQCSLIKVKVRNRRVKLVTLANTNISKKAIITGNVYMYKNKVPIPPLLMQDDTLAISACGFKTTQVNELINTNTNIMGLQFGREKCVKMHIGKKLNSEICPKVKVDSWKDNSVQNIEGKYELKDTYDGKEIMKHVRDKKYLGSI